MVTTCPALNSLLGRSAVLVGEVLPCTARWRRSLPTRVQLLQRLKRHSRNNNVRINILRILTSLFESHQKKADLLRFVCASHSLHRLMESTVRSRLPFIEVVQSVALDKSAVMVAPLAAALLDMAQPYV